MWGTKKYLGSQAERNQGNVRGKIIIPIVLLLSAFCGALGFAVYVNGSAATSEFVDKQIDVTLHAVESQINMKQAGRETLSNDAYQEIVSTFDSIDGGVFIVDERGDIIADSREIMVGFNVADHDWYIDAISNSKSKFTAYYGKTDVHAHGSVLNGKFVVSYLSSETVDKLLTTPLYVIFVVGIFSVALLGVVIYLLVTRQLINPVESLYLQIKGLFDGQMIELKPLKGCSEIEVSARRLNKFLEIQLSTEEHLRRAVEEGLLNETKQATSFDYLDLLREVVEKHREQILAKKISFSLRVSNEVPHIIFADREAILKRLMNVFEDVVSEAETGSKVKVEVSLLPMEKKETEDVTIAFEVSFNALDKKILLKAKRG